MKKKIIIAAILVLILSISLVLPMTTAFADYSDLDANSIVNFNQIFNNTKSRGNYNSITFSKNNATYSVSGSFTNYTLNIAFNESSPSINLYSGHKYYLDFKLVVNSGSTPTLRIINSSGSIYNSGNVKQIFTMSSDQVVSVGFFVQTTQTYNFSVTPMLIDLTQMFGANEPNLSECESIFTSDYYLYTLNMPMYLGRSPYGEFGSINYSANTGSISPMVPNNANNAKVSYSEVDNSSRLSFYTTITADSPSDCVFIWDFKYTFSKGSIITIVADGYYLNGNMTLMYADDTNYYSITSIPIHYSNNNGTYTYTFTAEYDFSVFYINSFANSGSLETPFATFSTLQINVQSYDSMAAQISDSYTNGYNKAVESYQPGTNNYNQIYLAGKQEGVESASSYSFLGLISSVVDTPINAVLSMLDFDLLGINMKSFYLSLFTFCIVLFVIKLII